MRRRSGGSERPTPPIGSTGVDPMPVLPSHFGDPGRIADSSNGHHALDPATVESQDLDSTVWFDDEDTVPVSELVDSGKPDTWEDQGPADGQNDGEAETGAEEAELGDPDDDADGASGASAGGSHRDDAGNDHGSATNAPSVARALRAIPSTGKRLVSLLGPFRHPLRSFSDLYKADLVNDSPHEEPVPEDRDRGGEARSHKDAPSSRSLLNKIKGVPGLAFVSRLLRIVAWPWIQFSRFTSRSVRRLLAVLLVAALIILVLFRVGVLHPMNSRDMELPDEGRVSVSSDWTDDSTVHVTVVNSGESDFDDDLVFELSSYSPSLSDPMSLFSLSNAGECVLSGVSVGVDETGEFDMACERPSGLISFVRASDPDLADQPQ